MGDQQSPRQEAIIDAENMDDIHPESSQHDEPSETKPKKKSHLKRYMTFILILGVTAWVLWTFSPQPQNNSQSWNQPTNTSPQQMPIKTPAINIEKPATPVLEKSTPAKLETPKDVSPMFEAAKTMPTSSSSESIQAAHIAPNAVDVINATDTVGAVDSPELTATLQDLQQQVRDLTFIVTTMQQQQLQWSQQQVRSQLFSLLQQAANPNAKLQDVLMAWKSISFLPLLSQDKRDTAQQAFNSLQDAQQRILLTQQNITGLIHTLAQSLHPKALQEITQDIGDVVDSEQQTQQTDVFYSWLDWLKQQFVITKVNQDALQLSDDPYAETKQLMTQLNQLKNNINQQSWAEIGSLTTIIYQLEQHGLDTPLNNQSLAQLQQDIEVWQHEAQAWMVQL